jgi:iron complex outermembrane receptor protein
MKPFRPNLLAATIAAVLLAPAHAIAEPAPDPAPAPQNQSSGDTQLETVVVTGTRVAGRSATDTAVPIDVIDVEKIERVGSTELNQVLSVALPSFNFPRPGLADGTDTVRPATLRGLAPDQSLVLVNSKRRHTAALVNVNGTVGRGSAAVDLNTIPTAAIQSVEVLRDGASAQYGSDAIAGVLNVLLRSADSGGNLTASYGQRETSFRVPTTPAPSGANWVVPPQVERDLSDGDTFVVGGWKGFAIGDGGFLTLSAEYRDQQRTERGGFDFRQQYPRLPNGQFDPREATINRFNAWYGEPEVEQLTLFANGGLPLGDGRLYGWASWQKREAVSAGFYRTAQDARNVIQIYPDGFLPQIAPDVDDASVAFGYEWNWGEWSMDSSLVWGRNKMAFTIQNTLNRSIGPTSKTVFDAGGYDYDQLVFNFSGVRSVDVGALASPLNIAAGLEARRESYSIFAGEPDSWRNGGVLLNGQPTASGAQVFPGFRPANEVDESRNAVGAYIDFEANLTERLLGSAAIRAEDYSDFGSNLTGKVALRYDFTEAFAVRGSLQNGFRAPSLQQQFFTATSTNFINGVPFDITTFPVNDPVAIALGAQPLDAEESTNVSLGFVANFGGASFTVDAYRIKIDDRIVLSENLTQTNVRQFLTQQGFIGIGGGRFFINGVDTTTRGVDAVFTAPRYETGFGSFDLTLAGNWNKTEVTRVPTTAPLAQLNPPPVLFDRLNVLAFERGNPRSKQIANLEWQYGDFSATLRGTRYGEVLSPANTPAFDFALPARWLADLEGRWQFSEQGRVAIGADNLFDVYPKPFNVINNTTGNTPFSNYSPFGRSGRFVYARLSWDF